MALQPFKDGHAQVNTQCTGTVFHFFWLTYAKFFRQHFIEPFLSKLRHALSNVERYRKYQKNSRFCLFGVWLLPFSFILVLSSLVTIYPNESYERFFGGVPVAESCTTGKIVPLISTINGVMTAFGLDEYYKNPRPHISLAWTLRNPGSNATSDTTTEWIDTSNTSVALKQKADEAETLIPRSLDDTNKPLTQSEESFFCFKVSCICVRTGSVVTRIPLTRGPSYYDSTSEDSFLETIWSCGGTSMFR